MITILKWRLSERPTPENLLKLVESGIISKEEAKKIVLDEGEVNQTDIEALKGEMTILRKMVLELSDKTGKTTEIVRIIEKEVPYYIEKWNGSSIWKPYYYYCTMSGTGNMSSSLYSLCNNKTAGSSNVSAPKI
jgi:polyhydroxyalkanoate synthesis regulator phasin